MRRFDLSVVVCSLAISLWACGDDPSMPTDAGEDAGVDLDAAPGDASAADAGGGADASVFRDAGFAFGDPIEAPVGVWTFVDFPESRCMNDTPTGIGINIGPQTDKLVIFLMGGNACFTPETCAITAYTTGFDRADFQQDQYGALRAPMFDRLQTSNPFRDWSFVFVPYCTGDVHAGANSSGQVGNTSYNFHGFLNMTAYLERVVPTFAQATDVMLTGVSAGGFGAAFNFVQVQEAFGPDVRVTLIDDSGPPMGEDFLAPCLQDFWRGLWGLDFTLPEDCDGCFSGNGVFAEPYIDFAAERYPDRSMGFISSTADNTIRSFWGFGQNNCALLTSLGVPNYPAATFQQGLEDLRDRILSGRKGRLYMPTSTRHVWLGDPIWTVENAGVNLADWIMQAIEDDPDWPNAP